MSYVAKITSKGQLTLPGTLRKNLGLSKDSYVMVDAVGEYLLMKKIKARMEEITEIFENEAKKKNITKENLLKILGEIQKKKWKSAGY